MIYAEGVNGNFLPHEILDRNCPSILHPEIKVLVVSGVIMKLHCFMLNLLYSGMKEFRLWRCAI